MSAGGTEALLEILACLPADYGLPIALVQHLHPTQSSPALVYQARGCLLKIKEAQDKEALRPGFVYFAPPNYHLVVEMDHTFGLNIDPKVNFCRPSVDVLFESAADVYQSALIGVILSGANRDGAAGLQTIRQRGGLAIVQSPQTAESSYMPEAAIEAAQADYVLPARQIGQLLAALSAQEA